MKTVCILSGSDLDTDPRVNRQIRFLAGDYRLITIGFNPSGVENAEHVSVPQELLLHPSLVYWIRRACILPRWYEGIHRVLPIDRWLRKTVSEVSADVFVVNDLMWLPAVCKAARGSRILFDAHEYYPEELSGWRFRTFRKPHMLYLCRKYIPRTAGFITVCDAIADRYEADIGVRPTVITNAPDYSSLDPKPAAPGRIRLVHHGGALRGRHIESMIRMVDFLDERFELFLMLVSMDRDYDAELRASAKGKRVRFLDPVPMRDIPKALNEFDVGVYILAPTNFNNLCALPNKLFEFIQARLAVAIGPSPEMAKVVRRWDCGVVAEDFSPEKLAAELGKLDAGKISYYKSRSHLGAAELSAEKNGEIFRRLVARAEGSGSGEPCAG